MYKFPVLLLTFLSIGTLHANGTLRTAAELAAVNRGATTEATNFVLTATLTRIGTGLRSNYIYVADGTNATSLQADPALNTKGFMPGDRIRIVGTLEPQLDKSVQIMTKSATRVGSTTPPPVTDVSVADAQSGRFDFRIVRLSAVVQDAFVDEVDPEYAFVVLLQGDETIYAALPNQLDLASLPGATISAIGVCDAYRHPTRRHRGRVIDIASIKDLVVLQAATTDTSTLPDVSIAREAAPSRIHTFGRLKATGTVLAAWSHDMFMIRTDLGEFVCAETATPTLPTIGDIVETVGFPETDLYNINLMRAVWRKTGVSPTSPDLPLDITSQDLVTNDNGIQHFHPSFNGQAVCLTGLVRSLPSAINGHRLFLECDEYSFPVDLSTLPNAADEVALGSRITVSGICIMNVDKYRPNAAFPRIRGFTIVMRTCDSIEILSQPSWWTQGRIWSVFGGLVLLLMGVFIWNAALRRLANRWGRELAKERLDSLTSDLKVEERTRLAVELHDTIAQMLTGVSLEIDTARDLKDSEPDEMDRHLRLAAQTLSSCRNDLRNCMWDLRNQTLDEINLDDAIRRTLAPHLAGTQLAVRFAVPREMLSDNTALAILRMIRELTLNAIRHGHATAIKVAGCIEGGRLLFSVTDNGCGFNPDTAPSVDQGHFGLQGILERAELLNGEMTVKSAPGKDTKVSIKLTLPQQQIPS